MLSIWLPTEPDVLGRINNACRCSTPRQADKRDWHVDRQACGQTERHVDIKEGGLNYQTERQEGRWTYHSRQIERLSVPVRTCRCQERVICMCTSFLWAWIHLSVCVPAYKSLSQAVSLPTFKYGTDLPDPCCSLSVILPQSQLHVEERHACYHHEEEVRYQESTCTHKDALKVLSRCENTF